MLKTRILTALVLLPIMLYALFALPQAAWAAFSWLIVVVALWEFTRMAAIGGALRWGYLAVSTALAGAAWSTGFQLNAAVQWAEIAFWFLGAPI